MLRNLPAYYSFSNQITSTGAPHTMNYLQLNYRTFDMKSFASIISRSAFNNAENAESVGCLGSPVFAEIPEFDIVPGFRYTGSSPVAPIVCTKSRQTREVVIQIQCWNAWSDIGKEKRKKRAALLPDPCTGAEHERHAAHGNLPSTIELSERKISLRKLRRGHISVEST